MKTVTVDGIVYVEKSGIKEQPAIVEKNYAIVRSSMAGVFAGEIVKRINKEVEMKNARRLWYWDGAASLSQLAMEGVTKPETCKFPCEVTKSIITEVCEIIYCTKKAINSIKGVPVWRK